MSTTSVEPEHRYGDEKYQQALDADIAAILATFPVLTPEQCDRIAVLLWPPAPLPGRATFFPPRVA